MLFDCFGFWTTRQPQAWLLSYVPDSQSQNSVDVTEIRAKGFLKKLIKRFFGTWNKLIEELKKRFFATIKQEMNKYVQV